MLTKGFCGKIKLRESGLSVPHYSILTRPQTILVQHELVSNGTDSVFWVQAAFTDATSAAPTWKSIFHAMPAVTGDNYTPLYFTHHIKLLDPYLCANKDDFCLCNVFTI